MIIIRFEGVGDTKGAAEKAGEQTLGLLQAGKLKVGGRPVRVVKLEGPTDPFEYAGAWRVGYRASVEYTERERSE